MAAKSGRKTYAQFLTKYLTLQTNAVRIMTFSDFKAHSEPSFKKFEMLKILKDNIVLQNCLFVYDYLQGNLPNSFINTFKRVNDTHPIITQSAFTGQLVVPSYNTTRYGLNSIYKKCIDSWNMITSEINKSKKMDNKTDLFKMYSRNELKTTLTKHLFSVYMGS